MTTAAEASEIGNRIAASLDAAVTALFGNHFDSGLVSQWQLIVPDAEQLPVQRDVYVKPLLRLLIDYCGSADDILHAVYLDERLRYAPHRLPQEQRQRFHQQLVVADFDALVTAGVLDEAQRCDWDELHAPLISDIEGDSLAVLAVGDCLFNELRVFAPHEARKAGINLDMRCIYFSAGSSGGMDHQAVLDYVEHNPVDMLLFSFFSFDAIAGYSRMMTAADKLSRDEIIEQCQMLITMVDGFVDSIRAVLPQTMVIHNVSGLPLRRWRKRIPLLSPLSRKQQLIVDTLNTALTELVAAKQNVLLMDEAALSESKGLRQCAVDAVSQKRYGGMFHTSRFGRYLTTPYNSIFNAYLALSKCKLLLIDFDNTIWRGVMADGDVTQLEERQLLLRKLKEAGVLLVALSKNSPENIRWQEMVLQQDDFALLKISWQTKVESVLQAAHELNLGVDSFVLVDDNRHERFQIENEIPEVRALDADAEATWDALAMMFAFPNTKQTEEARNRTQMYQQQAQRQQQMSESVDFSAMMAKLDLWYSYSPATLKQMTRMHELVSRTNQFNTTTQRYTEEQLQSMVASDEYDVMLAEMGDRFGSLGVVGVIVLRYGDDTATIEAFIMSCRAMGFGLENQLLYRAEQSALGRGVNSISGLFVASDRNQPCAGLYQSNGYTGGEDQGAWLKQLPSDRQCEAVDWFTEADS